MSKKDKMKNKDIEQEVSPERATEETMVEATTEDVAVEAATDSLTVEAVTEETPAPKEKKERAPRKTMDPAERKAKANAYYANYRQQIRNDPEKEAKYRQMKRDASKRFNDKRNAERARLKELEAKLAGQA